MRLESWIFFVCVLCTGMFWSQIELRVCHVSGHLDHPIKLDCSSLLPLALYTNDITVIFLCIWCWWVFKSPV